MKLTAIIPTFNEESNIEAVIQSVLFADEILIADSFSTDKTLEIAKKYPVKIVQREYQNSASQKNWVIPQAKNEWILLVDADERVTPQLEEEIKNVLASQPEESAFWIYRKNYFMGKAMNHSGLNTDKVIRLFKRDECKYQEKNVHSEIETQGKVGFLKEKFTHNTYISFDDYIYKKNRYAWWSAGDHFNKNTEIGIRQLIFKPFYRFFKHYFIQFGLLDGLPGLVYAFVESYGVFTRYVKIWLMQKGQYENHVNNKPKFLLYMSYPYGINILKPLEKKLNERGFEVAWFSEFEKNKTLFEDNQIVFTKSHEVNKWEPSIILAASNEVPHFFPGMKVQVFHGFNAAKRKEDVGHFRIRGLFDVYCTQGPSTTEYFKVLEKKHKHFKVIETGWPKMDNLFPVNNSQNKIPVVLVASTFTEHLSLAHNHSVFEELKRLISLKRYNWIFTLHDKMDEKVVQKFKELALLNQIPFIESPKNMDHLKNADILFSDSSSIITEFILQDKPVITFRNSRPNEHLINITSANDLEKSIEFALSYPEKLMLAIQNFNQQEHPYKDGKSSDRIIDAVLKMHFSKEIINLDAKPFNFVRKYQLRKRFN